MDIRTVINCWLGRGGNCRGRNCWLMKAGFLDREEIRLIGRNVMLFLSGGKECEDASYDLD